MSSANQAHGEKMLTRSDEHSASLRVAVALDAIRLKQREIARIFGVTPQHLSHVKTGLRSLSKRMAFKMEDHFGVSAEWLMTGQGDILSDPGKAAQYIEFEREAGPLRHDFVYRDARGRRHVVDLEPDVPRHGKGSVALLDELVGHRIGIAEKSAGIHVKVPFWVPETEFYSVRAAGHYGRLFRKDEFLLIQHAPESGWKPHQVDGRLCVIKSPDGKCALSYLETKGSEDDMIFSVIPLSPARKKTFQIEWQDLKVAGIVVLAFRTHFRRPRSR